MAWVRSELTIARPRDWSHWMDCSDATYRAEPRVMPAKPPGLSREYQQLLRSGGVHHLVLWMDELARPVTVRDYAVRWGLPWEVAYNLFRPLLSKRWATREFTSRGQRGRTGASKVLLYTLTDRGRAKAAALRAVEH